MMHKAWSSIEEVPYCIARSSVKFHGHTGGKNWQFESNLRLLGRSQLSNPSDLPCFYTCANKIQRILLKWFHLITLDINAVKHPWFNPWTWRNRYVRMPILRFPNYFSPIHAQLPWSFFIILLRYHGGEWNFDVIGDVDNFWGECIVLIGSEYVWNVHFNSHPILSYFLNYFTSHVIKGIKNGCPCIVEIKSMQVVPWLRPCICIRLLQGLLPRHNPAWLWSPQCMGNHS